MALEESSVPAFKDFLMSHEITKKRVAIVGTSGRLGSSLYDLLSANHEVYPFARGDLDLADPKSIENAFEFLECDDVIIPAALTAVDFCESHREEAYAINASGPGLIAEIAGAKGARVVFVSTDFVFDGAQTRPYREDDKAEPISIYGASKLEGERLVLAASPRNLIVRVSWLYGNNKPAFPDWIIQQALKTESLSLPAEKIGSPTNCEDLSRHIEALIGISEQVSGIVHVSNSGTCSWQEWGQYCLDVANEAGLRLATDTIKPGRLADIVAFSAKRPVYSALDLTRFQSLTGIMPRDWKSAVRDYLLQSDLFPEEQSGA
jgi:dTDP-4-dehydrorhamnose reductase